MSTVHVCDFDGGIIPDGTPYLQVSDVREIVVLGGRSYAEDKGSFLTFHDGLCAAGWLGKQRVGVPR